MRCLGRFAGNSRTLTLLFSSQLCDLSATGTAVLIVEYLARHLASTVVFTPLEPLGGVAEAKVCNVKNGKPDLRLEIHVWAVQERPADSNSNAYRQL